MSRPRKPFGANHPGRLPATMMKVLAAEMSDPQRLRRGKQYAKDGSVLDIVIDPGTVTCTIQGSRATPYIAMLRVTPGDGMPLRRDVTTTCTCPDADWDSTCKHAVAAMFTLADEFLLEPELLDLWRGRDVGERDERDDRDEPADRDEPGEPLPRRERHLRLVPPPVDAPGRRGDRLAALLRFPEGAELPDVPALEPIDVAPPSDRRLADALAGALAEFRALDWDE